ncbi:MAG TPA: hypothetical protein DCM08_04090 [Microscillaceae bacterium]|jgi:rare lipoprotein A|nr:hypothetical protein [Microscillaceae bacterium]
MKYLFYTFSFLFIFSSSLVAQSLQNYKEQGVASYFLDKYDGRETVSGEKFDNDDFVGAHRTLPFNTMVEVKNIDNGKKTTVRIIDRGPYAHGRIIDVSRVAAEEIELTDTGSGKVEIKVVGEKGKLYAQAETKTETKKEEKTTTTQTTSESAFQTGQTYSPTGTLRKPKGFGVQIGLFSSVTNAQQACGQLTAKKIEEKFPLYIQVGWDKEKEKKVYRVLVGEFADKEGTTTKEAIKQIQAAGFEGAFAKPHFAQ